MPASQRSAQQTWQWLQGRPRLAELCAAHPAEWAEVQAELAAAIARRRPGELKSLVEQAAMRRRMQQNFLSGERDGRAFALFVAQQVRHAMTEEAIRQYAFSQATGVQQGRVRFNLFNGWVAQRLLFKRDLERKPVSLFWFRLLWPLLWQRRRLMPLVEKRGIYCFYSADLVQALAGLIAGRHCLEIAAGDGTLSRFLQQQGVAVQPSDDGSWHGAIQYPDSVSRMDAREALSQSPQVVICSWPPANNRFERQVFRTRSVETYIVIGSRSQFITGNWADYREQQHFVMAEDPALSRLVLPPELGAAVYVFQRKLAGGEPG